LSEKPNVSFDDYRAALVKNEALQTEITQLKDQLKDATDALTIVKAKFDVAEKAEKDSLVTSLVRDGNLR
jgi:cell division septum initiation protein DivIVA